MNISRKMSLIVVASVILVTLPSLWVYYQHSKETLLRSEIGKLTSQTQKMLDNDEVFFNLATSHLTTLSRLLTATLNNPTIKDPAQLFSTRITQFEDGAWRNRQETFDGRTQTGLFLPPDIQLTTQNKQFYLSAMDVIDVFGAATTSTPIFNNVWLLDHNRSELIFDVSSTDYVYLMDAATDYTSTPWMTLTSPYNNPDRTVKWTPVLFDPVIAQWMVSAIYPLDIDGEWLASLGIDIEVSELLSLLYSQSDQYRQEQHFLLTGDGDFVLAGEWQKTLETNPDVFKLDPKEHDLHTLFKQDITAKARFISPVTVAGKEYQVIARLVEPMGWCYFRLVPTHEILQPLHTQIIRTALLILVTVMLLGILLHTAVRKLIVRPLLAMAERAKTFANGGTLPKLAITNNDEVSELNQALQTTYDDLMLEKQQLLDSKHGYKQVITQIRDVIVQIDDTGKWHFLSPVWKQVTGYDYQQSLNKPIIDFIHPADKHVVERVLTILNEHSVDNWAGEVRLLTAEHGYVWVNMSLQGAVGNHYPTNEMIVGTIENIQNERIERAVNETLRTAEQMVLTANCQRDAMLDFVCKEMAYALGVALFWIKLSKDSDVELFHAGSGAPFLFDARATWAGLDELEGEFHSKLNKQKLIRLNSPSNQPEMWRQRLLNDNFSDGLLLAFNLESSTSGTIGIHSEYRDECDESFQQIMLSFASGLHLLCKLTEDQALMRLHRAAVENTANSIMITNSEGHIEWVNDAFVRQTLFQFDDVLGHTPRIFNNNDHYHGYDEDIWQTITAGDIWQGEVQNRRKDGSHIHVYQTITPLTNNQGDITHFIAVIEDITERKADQERIAFMATYDDLTKLPNRNLLHDRLEHSISYSARSKTKMAVLFIDIDNFKFINDSLGHQVGDELLRILAKRLTDALRKGDTVARFGGDEFVVVLPEIGTLNNIKDVAGNLLQAIQLPYEISEHELMVTGSVGISVYPDDSEKADDLIQHADSAMYMAKQQGRNNSQFYTSTINENITRRLNLEKALRQALEFEQFVVFYQPKINLATQQMTGMEALVRWQHPELGLISPVEFIPLAEETGIILALGEWVMLTACRQLYLWEQQYPDLINMSINVSARQFWQHDFTKRVASIIEETHVSSDKVELELTESVVMNDIESAIDTMNALKDLGVSLSIDDFGTGYSSLSYLQRFPVDVLKIDRCFVTDLQYDDADSAIVRSILALAENFKLRVVAEGIENRAQEHVLTDLGCHYGQGYLYSRPIDAVNMEVLLKEQNKKGPNPILDIVHA